MNFGTWKRPKSNKGGRPPKVKPSPPVLIRARVRPPIKLTGERSLQTKLHRLAYELEWDAVRVRDLGTHDPVANSLQNLSSDLGKLARYLDS